MKNEILIKLNIHVPYDPAIELMYIYYRDMKNYVGKKTYTQIFLAPFFVIAQNWKQPRCPPIEWLNQPSVLWNTTIQCKGIDY